MCKLKFTAGRQEAGITSLKGMLSLKYRTPKNSKQLNMAMNKLEEIYFKDFVKLKRGYDLPNDKIVDGKYPVVASTSGP